MIKWLNNWIAERKAERTKADSLVETLQYMTACRRKLAFEEKYDSKEIMFKVFEARKHELLND